MATIIYYIRGCSQILISVVVRFEWTADVNSKVFSLIGSKFGQFYSKSIQVQPSNLFIKLFKQHISARNSFYQGYIDIIQR